ncbi:ATP-binding cassette domain-containing protein [Rossellomorea marisflavi]|uniref:ATP-binding cassette domain-containing protein n=1 Tax=Rossellomorea marisflavi TaxID=189381 RepID=UPI003D2ED39D
MNDPITIQDVEKTVGGLTVSVPHMTIPVGTISALVGTNGAGKSTLFKMIMNLVKPDKGTISIFGKPVNGDDEEWKSHLSYQSQQMDGTDFLKGEDLRQLMSRYYPDWDEPLFQRVVSTLEIPLNKKGKKLSPGMQAKLSIALTLGCNAPVMLLDEPTASMDIPSRKLVIDLLAEIMETGEKTILLATHHVDDLKKLADYLIFFDGDEVGEQVEKDELVASHRLLWLDQPVPFDEPLPGELKRTYGKVILTNDPDQTRDALRQHSISIMEEQVPDLETVVTELLTKGEKHYV